VTLLASSSVAEQVYPGLFGFLIVAGLAVAMVFLFRSMNKQLRKISPDPRARADAVKPRQAAQSSAPDGSSKP
jgi:hypothetical protein